MHGDSIIDPIVELRGIFSAIDEERHAQGRRLLEALLRIGPRRQRIYINEMMQLTDLSLPEVRRLAEYLAGGRFGLLESLATFKAAGDEEVVLSGPQVYEAVTCGYLRIGGTIHRNWAERTRLFYKPTERLRRLMKSGIARA